MIVLGNISILNVVVESDERNVHCTSAENSNEHDFLACAEVQFEEFGNRNHDDVHVYKDVVDCGEEPENVLVNAIVDCCFAVPGGPCT
jgi:hypothetical protein